MTGTIPYGTGTFVRGLRCTVPLHPTWTLQTNTMRKGNTAHRPPSPAALSCLLRLTDYQPPREGRAFIFLVAGGTRAGEVAGASAGLVWPPG